jgi:trk system potassium uptake protein
MAHRHQILIIGCGRLGGVLARRLSTEGYDLVVIDRREASFDKLPIDFSGFKIVGNAIEVHVLRQARIEQADFVFATTTEDNTNLMVAQVAKLVFNVPRVIARVFDPQRESIYRSFGVETISPTKLAADSFMELIK